MFLHLTSRNILNKIPFNKKLGLNINSKGNKFHLFHIWHRAKF